jgi:sulfate adenylyltransferase subunit 2
MKYSLNHLDELEAESIFILRETAAQFEKASILFSGGKDSMVVVHLALKAFFPGRIPFSILHIDTGHNFPETLDFRDRVVAKHDLDLIIGSVQHSIDQGKVKEESGRFASRNRLQSTTLLDTIEENELQACIGGARRDEEKARAKERFFSHRDDFGQWDPKKQRPEIWKLFNGKAAQGEHFRVFPLNNWTEEDVWNYIEKENIELPSLYFSHKRDCVLRGQTLLPYSEFLQLDPDEQIIQKQVRFRTLGDITITGAIESEASTVKEIIAELKHMENTERGGRADDQRSLNSMEERKKEGYF